MVELRGSLSLTVAFCCYVGTILEWVGAVCVVQKGIS